MDTLEMTNHLVRTKQQNQKTILTQPML